SPQPRALARPLVVGISAAALVIGTLLVRARLDGGNRTPAAEPAPSVHAPAAASPSSEGDQVAALPLEREPANLASASPATSPPAAASPLAGASASPSSRAPKSPASRRSLDRGDPWRD